LTLSQLLSIHLTYDTPLNPKKGAEAPV